jgi:hypothetical protein
VAQWVFAHPAQWRRCGERPDIVLGYGSYGPQQDAMEIMLHFLDGKIEGRASPAAEILRLAKGAQKARDAVAAGHIDLFQ